MTYTNNEPKSIQVGKKYIFDIRGADAKLALYDQHVCRVTAETPFLEEDPEMSVLYQIRFPDGFRTSAFADELVEIPES